MNHRFFKWPAYAALLLTIFAACTKIDTTQLGTDLIPAVDNINTFETILPVVSNNYIVDDSTRLNAGDAHVVGGISNDPVFGKTSSTLFLEIKPPSFPFLAHPVDTSISKTNVAFDSAILIIPYLGYYGDSNNVVNLKVYEVNELMQYDTLSRPEFNIRATPKSGQQLTINRARFWGEKNIRSTQFRDSIKIKRGLSDTVYETVVNQLRVRLNETLAKALFFQDSSASQPLNRDSLFKIYFRGLAIEAGGTPEALFYLGLSGAKMEFYYRNNALTAKPDTTSSTITFNSRCAHAINFERDRTGSESSALTAQTPDWNNGYQNIFIQATPGTAGKIRIPKFNIDTFRSVNRVIHRAELSVTQIDRQPVSSPFSQLIPPNALYLDILSDTTKNIYKGMPYDLSPYERYYCYPSADITFSYFGGITNYEKIAGASPGTSDSVAVYHFNVTRYLQSVVTRGDSLQEFRLSAPFYNFYENCANGSTTYPQQVFPYTISGSALNPIGRGGIKVAGGNHSNPAVKMQLRIIYSKL